MKYNKERIEALSDYMKHWPYSPYTDLERQELVQVVGAILKPSWKPGDSLHKLGE